MAPQYMATMPETSTWIQRGRLHNGHWHTARRTDPTEALPGGHGRRLLAQGSYAGLAGYLRTTILICAADLPAPFLSVPMFLCCVLHCACMVMST
jgi:hypothetical protein